MKNGDYTGEDWKKLNGYNWSWLLREQPQFRKQQGGKKNE